MRVTNALAAALFAAALFCSPQAKALDLEDFFDESMVGGALLGDSVLGNGWELNLEFMNTSGSPIEILSVGPGPIVDPSSLGFPDVELANADAAKAALETASPGFEAYATAHAEGMDPPTKTWVLFELDSVLPTPFTVLPGGTFGVDLLIRNDTLGPDFTAPLSGGLTGAQINAAGEAVMAYDINFQVVPEPASALLLSLVGLALPVRRR